MTGERKPGVGPGEERPTLGARVRDLAAVAGEHLGGTVERRFAVIGCDRCGTVVALDVDAALVGDELHMRGWRRDDGSDFCPRCAGGAGRP